MCCRYNDRQGGLEIKMSIELVRLKKIEALASSIILAYEILQKTDGAHCQAWPNDYLPGHWVGSRLQKHIDGMKLLNC